MPTVESIGHISVTPIVAVHLQKSSKELNNELILNADEVDEAFWTPLSYFFDGNNNITDCYDIPHWPIRNETFVYRQYDYVYPTTGQSFAITGLTAHIIHQVANFVYNNNKNDDDNNNDDARIGSSNSKSGPSFPRTSTATTTTTTITSPKTFEGFLQRETLREGNPSQQQQQKYRGKQKKSENGT